MCFAWLYLDHFYFHLAVWMANQRSCPEAVALALYWYSHPAVCLEYRRGGNIPEYHSTRFAVFEAVEHRYTANFYAVSEIGFDPMNDVTEPVGPLGFGRNWLDSLENVRNLALPQLNVPVPGKIVDVRTRIADWVEGLPPHIAALVPNL